MSLLGSAQKYLLAGAGLVIAGLAFALKLVAAQKAAARAEATRQKVKAKGEEAARKHLQETQEKTREVDDDIRGKSDDSVTDSLRKYARDSDEGD